ncbi:MAG: NAD(+)/NADH kinase [Thermodesulfobacteriota bacterium]
MTSIPTSVGIIYKYNFEPARRECSRLKEWLEGKGIAVYTEEMSARTTSSKYTEEQTSIPDSVDWVAVFGGDGTLLGAARKVGRYGLPIVGINLGSLGFLTEIPVTRLYQDMERLIAGEIDIETRLMLQAKVVRDGKELSRLSALNDVVINKGALARIIELGVSIDDRFLTTFRADGLIIATPTGSTGHNLSAGGPIVYPALEALLVNPICPFTLTHRPIIIPATSIIEIRINKPSEEVLITFDGQVGFDLLDNDRIIISKSEKKLRLIKSPTQDYFDILRTKLKWGESSFTNANT